MNLTVRTIEEFCAKAIAFGLHEIGIAPVFASVPFGAAWYQFGCVELSALGPYELHAVIPVDSGVTKTEKVPEPLYDVTLQSVDLIKKTIGIHLTRQNKQYAVDFTDGIFGGSMVKETCETFYIGQQTKIARNSAVKENEAGATP